jgi:hypothetical protein
MRQIDLLRILVGVACLILGGAMILRYKPVGDRLKKLRFKLLGWAGGLDEYMSSANVTTLWRGNAILGGLFLVVVGIVNIATSWS